VQERRPSSLAPTTSVGSPRRSPDLESSILLQELGLSAADHEVQTTFQTSSKISLKNRRAAAERR